MLKKKKTKKKDSIKSKNIESFFKKEKIIEKKIIKTEDENEKKKEEEKKFYKKNYKDGPFTNKFIHKLIGKENSEKWSEPKLDFENYKNDSIRFQQCGMKYYNDKERGIYIRLFGRTEYGNSVSMAVFGFFPYFYLSIPDESVISLKKYEEAILNSDVFCSNKSNSELKENINFLSNKRMKMETGDFTFKERESIEEEDLKHKTRTEKEMEKWTDDEEEKEKILKFEIIESRHLIGFKKKKKFLKIIVSHPKYVGQFRKLVHEKKFIYDGCEKDKENVVIYEANIDFCLRFCADLETSDFIWVQFEKSDATLIEDVVHGKYYKRNKQTRCQLEFEIEYKKLKFLKIDKLAPFRIITYDIECIRKNGEEGFVDAEKDPIINISMELKIFGEPREKNRVLDLTLFDSVVDMITNKTKERTLLNKEIVSFNVQKKEGETEEERMIENEKRLLLGFKAIMIVSGCDLKITYNGTDFDDKYVHKRAEKLGIYNKFATMSKVYTEVSFPKETITNSKQRGVRKTVRYATTGIYHLDLLELIKDYWSRKFSSYSLNTVSSEILKMTKIDLHHTTLYPLFKSGPKGRGIIGTYCTWDSVLTSTLADALKFLPDIFTLTVITNLSILRVTEGGQQQRIYMMLLIEARKNGFIIPVLTDEEKKRNEYQGATVLPPKIGFYTEPVVTFDFGSLYPSIMLANNLDYTTCIKGDELKKLLNEGTLKESDIQEFTINKKGDKTHFLRNHVRKGLLSIILEKLLKQRKIEKDVMKDCAKKGDKFGESLANVKQLNLKKIANSTYGFSGTGDRGILPEEDISKTVTSEGRRMIEATKNKIETDNTGSKIIYGDTDSVLVCMNKLLQQKIFNDFFVYLSNSIDKKKILSVVDETIVLKEANEKIEKVYDSMDSIVWWASNEAKRISLFHNSQKDVKSINLEFEKVFIRLLLVTKKKYSGWKVTEDAKKLGKIDEEFNMIGELCTMGLEVVKRDRPIFSKNLLKNILKLMIKIKDKNEMKIKIEKLIVSELERLINNEVGIDELIISKTLSKEIKDYKTKLPHICVVEKKMKRNQKKNVIPIGERVPYVFIRNKQQKSKKRKGECAEDPDFASKNCLPIDIDEYINITKKMFERVLPHLLPDWEGLFDNLRRNTNIILSTTNVTMENYFKRDLSLKSFLNNFQFKCGICGTENFRITKCKKCDYELDASSVLSIWKNLKWKEIENDNLKIKEVKEKCKECKDSLLKNLDITCQNLDCKYFFQTINSTNRLNNFKFKFLEWKKIILDGQSKYLNFCSNCKIKKCRNCQEKKKIEDIEMETKFLPDIEDILKKIKI
jgi:DNA polymerase delta subunit 1